MSDVVNAIEDRGIQQGIQQGEIGALARLVRKGRLTLQEAAEEMALTADEFVGQCKKYNLSL